MMLLISVLAPMLGAAGLFIWRPKNRRVCHVWTFVWTLLTSLCVLGCLLNTHTQSITLLKLTTNLTLSFRLDGLGRVFSGMVAVLWPLATLYAFEYMEHEGGDNHFFGFYMLSYSMTLAIAFAEDMMTMYVFYELLSLSTLFLVMHGMKAKNVHAGRKYMYYMLGGASMAFLGFGAKAAVWPLHSWLPTAGVAPTPVTALLHAVAVVKAGVFAVI
ncbi:MAG: hypothetical protein IJ956_00495, partial [Akkermansia sp.]|nr:hypothetical protein [Akkermansia sp.]